MSHFSKPAETVAKQLRQTIFIAMKDSDQWVVTFDYKDSKGACSRRVVSPIRFVGADRMLGLCLSREEPRQFYLARCFNVHLKNACDYLMPVPMLRSKLTNDMKNLATQAGD